MVSKCSQFLNLLNISSLYEYSYTHKTYMDNKKPKWTNSFMLLLLHYMWTNFWKEEKACELNSGLKKILWKTVLLILIK